jgi:hypothetical protein
MSKWWVRWRPNEAVGQDRRLLGGFWGLLFGSAFFAIPGIGPVLVAGHLVAWIVGALEGAVVVGGLSALGAGLVSMGIPKSSILQYESAVKSDKFLLIVNASPSETAKAKGILDATQAAQVVLHPREELVAAR